ncbi:MAG: hypothetical protein QOI63_1687 [Thermoplasmata archaeon]|jgi:hypothetical protein|nr:hypothetical protein [Thermoplasmata archaeon]
MPGTWVAMPSLCSTRREVRYVGRLLVLGSGDILWSREDHGDLYAFRSTGQPLDAWRPVITACPAQVPIGGTVSISGRQFNGMSQAVGYGDDHTAPTNYPLVRIRNLASGRVRYCRTANHTSGGVPSMGVATGPAIVTTTVRLPGDLEPGPSELVVVANGIPSLPFEVEVRKG